MATFWCMTVDPTGAPTMRPTWSPTVIGISHQPSPHARMPRSFHMRPYSESRSSALRGIASQRVVDEVRRVREDRELRAVVEELSHGDEPRWWGCGAMRAMVLERAGAPLVAMERADPTLRDEQVLLRVRACGVCRTDLHIVDGELTRREAATRPRSQIVGEVLATAREVRRRRSGWACPGWAGRAAPAATAAPGGRTSASCARFTGYTIDGGYADCAPRDERFCFPLPGEIPDRPGGASPVRRADRLPRIPDDRRRDDDSASTASAPPRTSSARWPCGKADACSR